ncbi:MAG: hypothetical protein O3A93_13075 [Chloroflexi bacterium]|nr:hypothetical protein [Chloroflexota bacterium]MDA1272167.1 hypothetical protein [Chloroflexota bacterium]PKB59259.1 MAG: hypothetical protein BZY83_02675 [SAR202 cluster bacterium Casp-Chloro-G2]
MITSFRISDALRCLLVNAPGGANLAAPTESVVRCRPLRNSTFWRETLARSTNRVTVGDWNGMELAGLASARVRSGVRAWEVDRLHLQDPEQALELLEQVVACAGHRGAERVFLRVTEDSPVLDLARQAGFFPYYEEIHLTGLEWTRHEWTDVPAETPKAEPNLSSHMEKPLEMFNCEDRTAPDSHGLFQLYCAATPHRVRDGTGVTFEQWRDSREQPQPHRRETVLKHNGKVVGWRMRELFGSAAAGQMLAHPDHPGVMPNLVQMSCDTPNWLMPSYQENAAELLRRRDLREAGRYIMLIKTVAVPVRNRGLSYVEA